MCITYFFFVSVVLLCTPILSTFLVAPPNSTSVASLNVAGSYHHGSLRCPCPTINLQFQIWLKTKSAKCRSGAKGRKHGFLEHISHPIH
jgi:hypothetical protein